MSSGSKPRCEPELAIIVDLAACTALRIALRCSKARDALAWKRLKVH
jgi:hypothetical protein